MRWIALALILLVPMTVIAQNDSATTVTIDSENRGTIEYIVEDAPEYITIEAIANDTENFDSVIWVVDSDNHLRAYNNNQADNSNALIENLLLTPDTYTIWVDSFNGVSEGDVVLSIITVDPFNEIIETGDTTQSIIVTLPEDMVYRYMLDLSTNNLVSIHVRDMSGTLDPYLQILDDSEVQVVANDDHQSSNLSLDVLDSLISDWDVSDDGLYTIEVRDFLGNSGQFELSITITDE
ncbi:MAG: hypothetical protein Phog2KO_33970 [Phototrophicaceae bacterium]